MKDCSQNRRFNLQNWVKYSKMWLQRYRDNKSEFIARTQFFGKSEFVLSLIILFENKHSNFVYFRFLQKMFSKMLTDTLVLLLCTAATAGENGKFPGFNPTYAPGPVVAVRDFCSFSATSVLRIKSCIR